MILAHKHLFFGGGIGIFKSIHARAQTRARSNFFGTSNSNNFLNFDGTRTSVSALVWLNHSFEIFFQSPKMPIFETQIFQKFQNITERVARAKKISKKSGSTRNLPPG